MTKGQCHSGTDLLVFRPSEVAVAIALSALRETQVVEVEKALSCCIHVVQVHPIPSACSSSYLCVSLIGFMFHYRPVDVLEVLIWYWTVGFAGRCLEVF